MTRGISRKIGTVLIVVVIIGISGAYLWSQVGPEHNARLWLDKTNVGPDESLTLYIRNLGSKRLGFGQSYIIFREYDNGTIEMFNFSSVWGDNWAWTLALNEMLPFGTGSHGIFTGLEPGDYYILTEYTVEGVGDYVRTLYFTVE